MSVFATWVTSFWTMQIGVCSMKWNYHLHTLEGPHTNTQTLKNKGQDNSLSVCVYVSIYLSFSLSLNLNLSLACSLAHSYDLSMYLSLSLSLYLFHFLSPAFLVIAFAISYKFITRLRSQPDFSLSIYLYILIYLHFVRVHLILFSAPGSSLARARYSLQVLGFHRWYQSCVGNFFLSLNFSEDRDCKKFTCDNRNDNQRTHCL
jgi:hypothetical protein